MKNVKKVPTANGAKWSRGRIRDYLINEICDIYPDYREYLKNEFYTILDYYSNQTFHFYEKDKKGKLKQKYINRLRVQVQFAIEDNDGTESN